MAGLSGRVAPAPPDLNGHHLACGWVAIALEHEHGVEAVMSERDLRMVEGLQRRPLGSARIGEYPTGEPRLHRPDLAILARDVVALAVEVELTPKAPQRLQAIVRAWRRARWVEGVRYYAAAGPTARGLSRAIARAHAEERVEVVSVEPWVSSSDVPPAFRTREGPGT